MASCAQCGSTILFGGKRQGALRFCSAKCEAQGALAVAANQLPAAAVERYLAQVHQGACPRCKGSGPVDVHTSHRVWSAVFMTSWSSRQVVACRPCGTKRKLVDALYSVTLGWWGLPWGVVMTPVQVGRNLFGAVRPPDSTRPSAALERVVRLQLASQVEYAAPDLRGPV
jgi:hypothetical protein